MHPLVYIPIALPLIYQLAGLLLSNQSFEPYAFWDARTLNTPSVGTDGKQWRNMGYWADTTNFSDANEALARKLFDFADAKSGGVVLDMAHGAGESLVMHLSQDPPPRALHALTSLASETRQAKDLVATRLPNNTIPIEWYTLSASYSPGTTSLSHPLNPMRGYMGSPRSRPRSAAFDDYESEDNDDDSGKTPDAPLLKSTAEPDQFDLIYILDAIYHFPPSVPRFLSTASSALAPGGVIAYTDVLPPPQLSFVWSTLILPWVVHVPRANLLDRPKSLADYEGLLQKLGYEGVKIEDWSEGVWEGLAKNLDQRGRPWTWVGSGVRWAQRNGWKFVAVRAQKVGV